MGALPAFLLAAFRAAALVLACGCGAAALAGQGGRWSDRLDALNHLEPLWLAGAILAGVLWLALGRPGRVTPALAALAVATCVLDMAPDVLAAMQARAPANGGGELKIVQFNLWERNADPDATARWIRAEDPDIVVIEEATHPIVRALRSRYPFRATCAERAFCSTMILSKVEPEAVGGLAEPGEGPWLAAAWARYPAAGGAVTVVGAHLTWPYPPGLQQAQSRRLAQLLTRLAKDRVIVAGDFNSTPWSFSLRRQDRLFGLERRTHALFSWPARPVGRWRLTLPAPLVPIDHVYAGSAWRTLSVRRGPKLGSDHFPVVVTLSGPRPG